MAEQTDTAWHKGPMLGFDLESTGLDVTQVRIVTAAIVHRHPDRALISHNRLANPGIDIPDEATAVHGITTAHAFEHGRPAYDVIAETVSDLTDAINADTPIVGMNLIYDFGLLHHECLRHGIRPLGRIAPVIDVRVLDKHIDPYRKGGRKLVDLCEHYGVKLDRAHDSDSDALGAMRVAYVIAARYPKLQIPVEELHAKQVEWAAAQTASFAAYRRKTGEPLDDEDGTWPIKAYPALVAGSAR